MAFQPLRPKDMSTLALTLEQLEERSLVGTNLLRRSTMGLRAMMREILASVRFRGHVASESRTFTNSNGDLSLDALPALGKRYLLSDCLGFGSFSQVVRATDSWSGQPVCIKVLRSDFGCFGWREAAIIRHLSTAIHSDQKYFVDLHDVLLFDGHVCLVLELMKATLFDLYGSFKIRSEPELLAVPSPQPPMQFVHPRPLRRGIFGNSQAEAKDSHFDTNKDVMSRNGRSVSGEDGIGQRAEVSLALRGADPPGPASRPVAAAICKISSEEVKTIRVVALSLVGALCVLRKEGVIHGDIKPENCFISWPRTSHAPQPPSSSSLSSSMFGQAQGLVKSEVKSEVEKEPQPTALADAGAGLRLCAMPEDWRVRLGDFGCSFHSSEVAKHYDEFELQSLPYRSPEVLLGLPFDYAIDMWSLGVIVVELLTQRPLFEAGDKAAVFRAMCTRLSAPPRRRFAAGKFSDEFFPHRPHSKPSPASSSSSSSSRAGSVGSVGSGGGIARGRDLLRSPFGSVSSSTTNHSSPDAELASDGPSVNFRSLVTSSSSSSASTSGLGSTSEELPYSQHLENIRMLLIGCLEGLSSDVATHIITFVAGLLHPDPDCRLTPIEALKHPFLCSSVFAPLSLLTGGPAAEQGAARRKRGVAALGIAKLKGVHAQSGRAKMQRLDT